MGDPQFGAVIVGAGVSGLYQLHELRRLGLSVRVFEAGGDLGGTWYWNRYPGCRFDSESYTYGLSFCEEILQEWNWSEHFAAQPETLRYLNFVAAKLDLRRDIRFGCRVRAAVYDEDANQWEVELADGARARSRLLITAIGAPTSSSTRSSAASPTSRRPTTPRPSGRSTWMPRPIACSSPRSTRGSLA